ncbi:peptidoglycan recognition protein family protein [Streptomyces sp. B21-083]|uniref:peptidoglycan recognition protein family protein n=1 Tax=Streptomyces sp. B21-083 TaxID=3039410 RepID=UPI002FF05941
MQLVTRAQLGWPVSAAPFQAATLGVKVHYEGAPVSTKLLTDHGACIAEWKAIRISHLANVAEGYSDVAYNYAACPHGFLLEGRGIGRRTGANGNQPLNKAHYAIVGLVGDEGLTAPTDAMLSAIRDGIELLRANGAGNEIKGHRDGYATECPGGPLYAWVQKGAPRPTTEENDVTLTAAEMKDIAEAVWAYPLNSPTAPANTDPARTAGTFLRYEDAKYAVLLAQFAELKAVEAGQTAALTALAKLVGAGVDTAEVVAAVQKAIAAAVVKVSVDVTGPAAE